MRQNNSQNGFTLIEMLIVLIIIGMLFSITMPVSYSVYQRYQASLKAQKILIYLDSLRLKAFLHGKDFLIYSKDQKLFIDNNTYNATSDTFVNIEKPILFFSTGATSGGKIHFSINKYDYTINIESPFGKMILTNKQ
ncbi:MAG: type II secretion system protein [Conexivisphaerales archaeon]